jgi:HAD superfamily hydrolase (TIGR01450 family)
MGAPIGTKGPRGIAWRILYALRYPPRAFLFWKGAMIDMLAEEYDVFLIDLDGVICIGNRLLPGSKETIEKLRNYGKKVYFLTNDPRFLRQELCERLSYLGINASQEDFITSGWATANYLVQHAIQEVYVIGTESLKKEISNQGVKVVEQGDCQGVVVGYSENTTFYEVQQAVRYIEKGAKFIATNDDKSFPSADGRYVATGAIVQAVQVSCEQRPIIIGKPYSHMFHMALKNVACNNRVVMIGDSPDTDILGAHQYGINAILMEEKQFCYPVKCDYRYPNAQIKNLMDLFSPNRSSLCGNSPDFPWPDTIEPGVAAVLFNEQGQIFLVKRIDNGLWGLPSGHVEIAETVAEAISRELCEETGLIVTAEKLVGVYSEPVTQVFSYPSGKITHFITLCFLCSIRGGTLQVDRKEISKAAFFDITQLPSDMMVMHPRWLSDVLANLDLAFIR